MPRREPRHDVLFEPVRIGPKTLRNRFYQVPHCTGFGVAKPWTQAAHRGLKAEGGWAAINTEYCSISPETDDAPYISARLWDDDDARALALVVEQAHLHGALAGVELWHGGALATQGEARIPTLAPTAVSSHHDPLCIARTMEVADIRRVQAEWVAAARRAADVGFDIVYVYGSHGYLPTQFLSPRTNRRTDAYGGSFENRARFWLETIELVAEAVGERCAIAVRIAADSMETAGVDVEEGLAFIRAADHLVDVWDIAIGSVDGEARLDSGPSRFYPPGYQLDYAWTRRAREATAKPIIGVGRLTDPDQMAEIVRSGVWDVIGAARPSIADPFLPRKIEEGRYDEIRECIGCNACYGRANWTLHLGCTQNATAGEEHRRGWHPERFSPATNARKDVLVVGAGASGIECAIVLGKRGFRRVHLADAAPEIGGLLRHVPRLPGLGDWGRLLGWRRIQLDRLRRSVTPLPGLRLDAAAVRDYGAELVVVATGAAWATDGRHPFADDPVPGLDAALPHVLTPEQVLVDGQRPAGRRVVVLDCEGYFMAASLAELLAAEGCEVVLATPFSALAPYCERTLEALPLRRRLHALGVTGRTGLTPVRADAEGLDLVDEHGAPVRLATDAIVAVTQRVADEALYLELASDPDALAAAGIEGLYRIGDCVAPRLLADAIFDGHRLGREIDGPDPAVARPYLRERPLVP